MSFRGLVCGQAKESIEGGSKVMPYFTASSGIDPMLLPTCLRWDDIPAEAFNALFYFPQ